MKRLITHVRPHLDDLCALWLLKRYLPEAADTELGFVATGGENGKIDEVEGDVCVGVGRGMFDEHKGDIGECATTLVWKHIKKEAHPADPEARAIAHIVEWVRQEDLGLRKNDPYREFSIQSLIEGRYLAGGKDDHALAAFGFTMLDGFMETQRGIVALEDDWEHRTEFVSRFGRAVLLTSDSRFADTYAYNRGFTIAVIVGKSRPYLTIRAPGGSGVDLTSVRDALKALDPAADWYLHHAKQMLISGGERAVGLKACDLPHDVIIDALR